MTKGNPSRAACAVTNVHDLRENAHAENGTHTHSLSVSPLVCALHAVCPVPSSVPRIAHRPQHRPLVLEMREGERRPHVAYVCARNRTTVVYVLQESHPGAVAVPSFFHPVVKAEALRARISALPSLIGRLVSLGLLRRIALSATWPRIGLRRRRRGRAVEPPRQVAREQGRRRHLESRIVQ